MLTFKRRKDMFFSEAQRVPPLNNWNCAPPFLAPEVLPPLLIMLFFSFSLSPELIQVENTKTKIQNTNIPRSTRFLHNATFLNLLSRRSCSPLMENGKWTKTAPISENFPHYLRPPAFPLPPLFIFSSSSTAGSYGVQIQSRALWQSVHHIHFTISRLSLKTTFANQFCKEWLSHHCEKNKGGHILILRWM